MNLKIDFLDVNCLQWSDHPYDPFDSHSEICWIWGILNSPSNEFHIGFTNNIYSMNDSSSRYIKFENENHQYSFTSSNQNYIDLVLYCIEMDNNATLNHIGEDKLTNEKFKTIFENLIKNNSNDIEVGIKTGVDTIETIKSKNKGIDIFIQLYNTVQDLINKDKDDFICVNKVHFSLESNSSVKCNFDDKSQTITTLGQSIQKEFDCKSNDGSNHYKTRIEFKLSE